ncbi:MAG: sulfatase [Verrucomicrobiota bacterium]
MRTILFTAIVLAGFGSFSLGEDQPDILMIAVDDLNDWNSLLDPSSPIEMPNLERLAARGVSFTRAYCVSAACNPSRVATLTGLRPSTTGVYGNKSDWRGALPDRETIFQVFRRAGYEVVGSGKLFHHHLDGAFHDDASFEEFVPMAEQRYPEEKINRAPEYGSRNTDWGEWPPREEETIDHQSVTAALDFLERASILGGDRRPLFLAVGIFKPHSPFFAPSSYHGELEGMPLPARRKDDWDDLPVGARTMMEGKKWFWEGMTSLETRDPGSYREFIEAYAACCRFADAQLGRILDGLEKSGRSDRTVVVLWSDHGFHLGEKNHIEKFALWEKANRVPYLVVAPGVTTPGSICDRPVDLASLYPTLLELAGLENDPACDGVSLVPLLLDPDSEWDLPALMTYGRDNHAVRSDRWRYIRYADGSEELYDHERDPNEWTNLAEDPSYAAVKEAHREWIPVESEPEVPPLRKR